MDDPDESPIPGADAVVSLSTELENWLRESALPLWEQFGVDAQGGGYFETLTPTPDGLGVASAGDLRRGRVVARQIYVFDVGRRLGWRPAGADPMAHGCEFLFSRMYGGQGLFHTAVDARNGRLDPAFSLYEQAFYLFALARIQARWGGRYPAGAAAADCLDRLRGRYGRTSGGFEESSPSTLPLKSNPHMHLLEAALEWMDTAGGDSRLPWSRLADELVGLCLTRFCDTAGGAIREYFDWQWRAAPGDAGRVIEPGHQFEWAWLLMRWSAGPGIDAGRRSECRAAAERLMDIGEARGVDPARGVAVNELWEDMCVKDPEAKLWPQTERIKAWCAVLDAAATRAQAERACERIAAAARSLGGYLAAAPKGLWSENCDARGRFVQGPSKASSFYHIACAIDVLQNTVEKRLEPTSALQSFPLDV